MDRHRDSCNRYCARLVLDAHTAVKVIACILAALCVVNCLEVEHSLSQNTVQHCHHQAGNLSPPT